MLHLAIHYFNSERSGRRAWFLKFDDLIKKLKGGIHYQFVYTFETLLSNQQVNLIFGIDEDSFAYHIDTFDSMIFFLEHRLASSESILGTDPNIFGAGYIRMINEGKFRKLILFGESNFGKFKKDLIAPTKEQLCRNFGVDEIIFM